MVNYWTEKMQIFIRNLAKTGAIRLVPYNTTFSKSDVVSLFWWEISLLRFTRKNQKTLTKINHQKRSFHFVASGKGSTKFSICSFHEMRFSMPWLAACTFFFFSDQIQTMFAHADEWIGHFETQRPSNRTQAAQAQRRVNQCQNLRHLESFQNHRFCYRG